MAAALRRLRCQGFPAGAVDVDRQPIAQLAALLRAWAPPLAAVGPPAAPGPIAVADAAAHVLSFLPPDSVGGMRGACRAWAALERPGERMRAAELRSRLVKALPQRLRRAVLGAPHRDFQSFADPQRDLVFAVARAMTAAGERVDPDVASVPWSVPALALRCARAGVRPAPAAPFAAAWAALQTRAPQPLPPPTGCDELDGFLRGGKAARVTVPLTPETLKAAHELDVPWRRLRGQIEFRHTWRTVLRWGLHGLYKSSGLL